MTMSNSTAVHSYGTTLSIDPAGGSSYTAQAEVIEMDFPDIKIGAKMRTNLLSPNAALEKIPGLIDGGAMKLKCNWTKAQYALFISDLRTALMSWKITFPLVGSESTASTLAGHGHIAELGGTVPNDDTITNDVTIEVSGLPVFTSGA